MIGKSRSYVLKVNKGISVIKKLRPTLPQKALVTIYKAFLRLLNDYGDIIFDQPQNESFVKNQNLYSTKPH